MTRLADRRGFLKALAATAAATMLRPDLGFAGPLGASAGRKVSLVAGRSRLRPHLGSNLAVGVRLGLEHGGAPASPNVSETGTGGRQLLKVAEATLRRDRPDVLLAVHHPGAAPDLGSLARAHGGRVLLVDPGANVPRVDEADPNVLPAGMQQWRADYALGHWAAAEGGRSAVIITSLYDTGYDLISAYAAGFRAGGGSEPVVLLTDDPREPGIDAVARIDQLAPDVVHVLHSGRHAAALLRSLGSGTGRLLSATSLTLDDAAGLGFTSASAWLGAGERFESAFLEATGEHPDEFAVFGYRTGLALADGQSAAEAGPLQLFEPAIINGRPGRRAIRELADHSAADPLLAELAAATRTGWTTPWLTL